MSEEEIYEEAVAGGTQFCGGVYRDVKSEDDQWFANIKILLADLTYFGCKKVSLRLKLSV